MLRVGVLSAQAGPAAVQDAPVEGAGAVQIALVGQHVGEVAEAGGGVGVVGSQAGLTDPQGALEQRVGTVEIALSAQDDAGHPGRAGRGQGC